VTDPGSHRRGRVFAFVILDGELLDSRYSVSWFGLPSALSFSLAFLSYTNHFFKKFKWHMYGAIGFAILFAAITFQLLRPNESQLVKLYYGNAELNGQTIDATYMPGKDERFAPGSFVLRDIRAEQMGRFPTDYVTVILYFSDKVICESGIYECHPIRGNEGFSAGFECTGLSAINPKESWPAPVFRGVAQGSLPNAIKARLEIFYRAARPAEANFTVNVRNVGTY
jgi:hypothetical protein